MSSTPRCIETLNNIDLVICRSRTTVRTKSLNVWIPGFHLSTALEPVFWITDFGSAGRDRRFRGQFTLQAFRQPVSSRVSAIHPVESSSRRLPI